MRTPSNAFYKNMHSTNDSNNSNISEEDLRQAVALFYDGETAPTITAKGEGKTAEEISSLPKTTASPYVKMPPY